MCGDGGMASYLCRYDWAGWEAQAMDSLRAQVDNLLLLKRTVKRRRMDNDLLAPTKNWAT